MASQPNALLPPQGTPGIMGQYAAAGISSPDAEGDSQMVPYQGASLAPGSDRTGGTPSDDSQNILYQGKKMIISFSTVFCMYSFFPWYKMVKAVCTIISIALFS